jgi:hypothetical protein
MCCVSFIKVLRRSTVDSCVGWFGCLYMLASTPPWCYGSCAAACVSTCSSQATDLTVRLDGSGKHGIVHHVNMVRRSPFPFRSEFRSRSRFKARCDLRSQPKVALCSLLIKVRRDSFVCICIVARIVCVCGGGEVPLLSPLPSC